MINNQGQEPHLLRLCGNVKYGVVHGVDFYFDIYRLIGLRIHELWAREVLCEDRTSKYVCQFSSPLYRISKVGFMSVEILETRNIMTQIIFFIKSWFRSCSSNLKPDKSWHFLPISILTIYFREKYLGRYLGKIWTRLRYMFSHTCRKFIGATTILWFNGLWFNGHGLFASANNFPSITMTLTCARAAIK